jgi:hypothetical protein
MKFWFREVSGWLLVGLSLVVFYLCYLMLRNHDITEAWPLAFIGIVVFRGGVQLLKVAVAARLWGQAQENAARAAVAPRPRVQPPPALRP